MVGNFSNYSPWEQETTPKKISRSVRGRSRDGPFSRYAEVVDRLEQILEAGRGVLASETLVTIEESLLTLDAAIEEIEAALADDPSSDLLQRLLVNRQRTRLGVLQRAAAAVQLQT